MARENFGFGNVNGDAPNDNTNITGENRSVTGQQSEDSSVGNGVDGSGDETGNNASGVSEGGNETGGNGKSPEQSAGPAVAKKRRGRPPGSGTGAARKPKTQLALSDVISSTLFNIHTMLAQVTGASIFAIQETEAKTLGDATAKLAAQYDLEGSINPKTLAWLEFGGAVSSVYGTRFLVISQAIRAERRASRQRNNGTVYQQPQESETPGETSIPPQPGEFNFADNSVLERALARQRRH